MAAGGGQAQASPDNSSRLKKLRDVIHYVGKACCRSPAGVSCPSPAGSIVAELITTIVKPSWTMPPQKCDEPWMVAVCAAPFGMSHPSHEFFKKEKAPSPDAIAKSAGNAVPSAIELINGFAFLKRDPERSGEDPSLKAVHGMSIRGGRFKRSRALSDQTQTMPVNMLIPLLRREFLEKFVPLASKDETLNSGN